MFVVRALIIGAEHDLLDRLVLFCNHFGLPHVAREELGTDPLDETFEVAILCARDDLDAQSLLASASVMGDQVKTLVVLPTDTECQLEILVQGATDFVVWPCPPLTLASRIAIVMREAQRLEVAQTDVFLGVVESVGDVVEVTSPSGLIEYVNPALEQILGHRPNDAIGRPVEELYGSGEDEHQPMLGPQGSESHSGIVITRHRDGHIVHLESTVTPVFGPDGQLLRRVAIRRDITDRTAALTEQLTGLGRLVAGLAHEINTPLGVSVTSASLLEEQLASLSEQSRQNQTGNSELELAAEALAILHTNLQRSVELIRKLKTVSVDQTADPTRRIELAPYLQDLRDSLSPLARRSGVTIELDCAAGIEVTTRPGVLVQILTNLVVNAGVHAYPGEQTGTVHISGRADDKLVVLRFSDRGVGMHPEVAKKVFEPFFTTASSTGGTGLGLFIVHNLVTEGLGGTLRLQTARGEGCSFEIRFSDREAADLSNGYTDPLVEALSGG